MPRLHRALLEAMKPTPLKVGAVLENGAVVRMEVDTTSGEPFEQGTGFHLRLLHTPATEGQPQRWTLLYGEMSGFPSTVLAADLHFDDLYATVLINANIFATRSSGGAHWAVTAEVLHAFLVDQYNTDDPDEAAEQMLVALGAEPRFMPRTLAR